MLFFKFRLRIHQFRLQRFAKKVLEHIKPLQSYCAISDRFGGQVWRSEAWLFKMAEMFEDGYSSEECAMLFIHIAQTAKDQLSEEARQQQFLNEQLS